MKALIKKDECIGCEQCVITCPKVFKMNNGIAEVIGDTVPLDAEESCREAAVDCPVNAIEIIK
jgi:ferredoxin